MFLRDLEEDEELRGTVNLYKDKKDDVDMSDSETEDEDENFPEIGVDDLLDGFDDLKIVEEEESEEEE